MSFDLRGGISVYETPSPNYCDYSDSYSSDNSSSDYSDSYSSDNSSSDYSDSYSSDNSSNDYSDSYSSDNSSNASTERSYKSVSSLGNSIEPTTIYVVEKSIYRIARYVFKKIKFYFKNTFSFHSSKISPKFRDYSTLDKRVQIAFHLQHNQPLSLEAFKAVCTDIPISVMPAQHLSNTNGRTFNDLSDVLINPSLEEIQDLTSDKPFTAIPLSLEGSPSETVLFFIDHQNKQVEYFDPRGLSINDRTGKKTNQGYTVKDALEKIVSAQGQNYSLVENTNYHLSSNRDGGLRVLDYIQRRLNGQLSVELFANPTSDGNLATSRKTWLETYSSNLKPDSLLKKESSRRARRDNLSSATDALKSFDSKKYSKGKPVAGLNALSKPTMLGDATFNHIASAYKIPIDGDDGVVKEELTLHEAFHFRTNFLSKSSNAIFEGKPRFETTSSQPLLSGIEDQEYEDNSAVFLIDHEKQSINYYDPNRKAFCERQAHEELLEDTDMTGIAAPSLLLDTYEDLRGKFPDYTFDSEAPSLRTLPEGHKLGTAIKPIAVPVVIKGKLRNHIVTFNIDHKTQTIEFYDSRGKTISDRFNEPLVSDPKQTIGSLFSQIREKFPKYALKENTEKHQHDLFNCGLYVFSYLAQRAQGKTFENIKVLSYQEVETMRSALYTELSRVEEQVQLSVQDLDQDQSTTDDEFEIIGDLES